MPERIGQCATGGAIVRPRGKDEEEKKPNGRREPRSSIISQTGQIMTFCSCTMSTAARWRHNDDEDDER